MNHTAVVRHYTFLQSDWLKEWALNSVGMGDSLSLLWYNACSRWTGLTLSRNTDDNLGIVIHGDVADVTMALQHW